MPPIPVVGYLSNAARTEGEMKTAFEDLRDSLAQNPNSPEARQGLTISSGVVTPTAEESLFLSLSGESAAADILDAIATTNIPAGSVLVLMANDPSGEPITVNHASGGSAQINLVDATDFILNAEGKFLAIYYDGTAFQELYREWGDQTSAEAALLTFFGLGDAATFTQGAASGQIPEFDDIVGRQSAWVPVSATRNATTNGPSVLGQVELTAGQPELETKDFDQTTDEHVQFDIAFPKSWDGGTLNFQVIAVERGGNSNTSVWGLAAVARADGDPFDTAFGAEVTVDVVHLGTADDVHVSVISGAVTVAGSPGAAELTTFALYRRPTDGSDDLGADAGLVGVSVLYSTDALNDA